MSFKTPQKLPPGNELSFKIIIIGDTSTGKSAILHRFVEGRFREGVPKHTIGVEFGSKTIALPSKTVKLHIWDTSGQERFRSVTHSYYRTAVGALVVYDITNRSSFENVKGWITDARTLSGTGISIILCGNKNDLPEDDREVSLLEGSRFAMENDCMFLETSASTGANVDEVFYKCAKTIMNKLEIGALEFAQGGNTLRLSTRKKSDTDDDGKIKNGGDIRMCCYG